MIWSGRVTNLAFGQAGYYTSCVLHLRIHFVCSKKTTPADYSFQALRIFVHLERNFTKVYCFNHLAYNSLIEYESMLTLHFLSYHRILALKEGRPAWPHRRLFPTIYRIGRVDNPNHASRLFYKKTPELLEKSTHNPTLFEIFLPKKNYFPLAKSTRSLAFSLKYLLQKNRQFLSK